MLPGPVAVLLGIAPPLIALLLACRLFRERAWSQYRAVALASSLSSLFTVIVITYVVFLGRADGVEQGFSQMKFGLQTGALQIFTMATAVVVWIFAASMKRGRTQEARGDASPGRPMHVVFSLLLLVLLGVALVAVNMQGTSR